MERRLSTFPQTVWGIAAALALCAATARAEEPIRWPFEPAAPRPADNGNQPKHIRLFGLQPAFLSAPPGLDDDPMDALEPDSGPDWLQVTLGNDNPFFDLRQRGDPGGVGYYRLSTQAKLVDTSATIFTVGMQAVTPAGLDSDGLANGPTIVSPGFSLFRNLGNGAALQAFVGKNFRPGATDSYTLRRAARCAVALQQPLGNEASRLNNIYWFVEGLGRFRYDPALDVGPSTRWDLVPGMQWKLADNWWMSGGVTLPLHQDGTGSRLWQLTCSFQF